MPGIRSNRTMWRAIKSLVFCLGLVLALVAVSFVSKPSIGSVDPWPAVRETSGQVDVLAMGSSRTYCTVMPMEMWRESGVTALDVTSGTQPMSLTYEYLRQSLTQQHPKVVLLELYMMGRADSFTLQRAHTNLDYMPMGVPRAAGILESTPPSEWLELFVPLVTSLNFDAPRLQWTDPSARALGQQYSNLSLYVKN